MIVNTLKKGARSVGRFLTTRAGVGQRRLDYFDTKMNEYNDATGGLLKAGLEYSGLMYPIHLERNILAGTITSMNALGKGLTTLGNTDYKNINVKNFGQGIQDLKQAYDLGSAVYKTIKRDLR